MCLYSIYRYVSVYSYSIYRYVSIAIVYIDMHLYIDTSIYVLILISSIILRAFLWGVFGRSWMWPPPCLILTETEKDLGSSLAFPGDLGSGQSPCGTHAGAGSSPERVSTPWVQPNPLLHPEHLSLQEPLAVFIGRTYLKCSCLYFTVAVQSPPFGGGRSQMPPMS